MPILKFTNIYIYLFLSFSEVEFKVNGTAGHGSLLLKNTAGEKLLYIMNKLSEFRKSESARLDNSNGALTIGDVTTVNLTIVEGGVQNNVIPALITATYDIRVAQDVDQEDFEAKVKNQDHNYQTCLRCASCVVA